LRSGIPVEKPSKDEQERDGRQCPHPGIKRYYHQNLIEALPPALPGQCS
jgi:hypothetical protein